MEVKLLEYTPNPDKTCAAAAMGCYSEEASMDIIETLTEEKVQKILRRTVDSGHHSIIEHASFTFSVKGVSRALTHQLVRHRIASYSQQSQRYVKLETPTFVTPPLIEGNIENHKKYNEFMKYAWETYNGLVSNGVLPNETTSNSTITMNARELHHFFRLRCCIRAQWEIRQMAEIMLVQVKEAAPIIFENAGPPCNECQETTPCEKKQIKMKKIAVLGWGSLIWDPQKLKIKCTKWNCDGPRIPIEFARISGKNKDKLTLVITPIVDNVQTLWNYMDTEDLKEAIDNLRIREDMPNEKNIGFIDLIHGNEGSQIIASEPIKKWAEAKGLEAVIWTDLKANILEDEVIAYLNSLSSKAKAEEYVRKAPAQVDTKIRKMIEKEFGWTFLEVEK
jgi:thymidylate synthase (FAD)